MKLFTVILVLCVVALAVVEARNIQGGGNQVQTRFPNRRFFARNGLQQQRVFQRNFFQGNRRLLRPRQRPLTQVVVKEPLAVNAVAAQPEVTIQAVPKVEGAVAVAQIAVETTEIPADKAEVVVKA